ncbi:MAG: hypothetical protein COW24_02655 [Candidatus Kerfeldbacteria bacterium CG15_BIG_FIL_POST_REV_8_21_14_020_45_12]|uniref:Uncharacterized protein n=1 Tax=Candidatus Kerfeldbacteria bacterium CG15_BIG_FIL_POST_REV_8_21_14_020_45_12 TaxID=2014247 RepID=A0A2M7H406_9BACT|nr:MAG: hypothetical protein COW24_02655 [Candidatus Kerfeldbacteria bacterium CG15_BIG_FIL_POST_REV_8_21_14_020_45_12]PJA93105.1 MAG: hypothetical protein CO132_04640 [Candidatus Kerfeldbacteria bacterium CG_4_9_14_3_um_filter_45_8]
MDPRTFDWAAIAQSGLHLVIVATIIVTPAAAIASWLVATKNNEGWAEPAKRWFSGAINTRWIFEIVADIAKFSYAHTERDKLHGDLRDVRDREDSDFRQAMAEVRTKEERRAVTADRRKVLRSRGDEVVGFNIRTATSFIVWALALVGLMPALAGSWFLKFQIGREFLTGSENLVGIPIWFAGSVRNITAVHIICALMVLIELVIGILVHLSLERLDQIRKDHIEDGALQYKALLIIGLMGGFGLLVLETVMGWVRGQMETGGDGAGTLFVIGISIGASAVTMALAYVLKSQFKHAAPFLAWCGKTLIFVPVVLFILVVLGTFDLLVFKTSVCGLLLASLLVGAAHTRALRSKAEHEAYLAESEARRAEHLAAEAREIAAREAAEEEAGETAALRREAEAKARTEEDRREEAAAARREAEAKAAIPQATLEAARATAAREEQHRQTLVATEQSAVQTARREAVQAQREQAEAARKVQETEEIRRRLQMDEHVERIGQMDAWIEEARGDLSRLEQSKGELEDEIHDLSERAHALGVKLEDAEVVQTSALLPPGPLVAAVLAGSGLPSGSDFDEDGPATNPGLGYPDAPVVDPSATGAFTVRSPEPPKGKGGDDRKKKGGSKAPR